VIVETGGKKGSLSRRVFLTAVAGTLLSGEVEGGAEEAMAALASCRRKMPSKIWGQVWIILKSRISCVRRGSGTLASATGGD